MTTPRLVHETIDSSSLQRRRKLRVWLPPSFDSQPHRRFPVIYASDAQMKFTERDAELPYGSWGVDECLLRLGLEVVVVAIDNSPQRVREYFPMNEEFTRYQSFVVGEVVPWAQERFRVESDPRKVAHMGSSMGGILSCALALNNPHIFGTALCLSPWFEVEDYRYLRQVLRPMQSKPAVRIYLDSGVQDWRRLDDGHRGTCEARLEFLRLGMTEGEDLHWLRDLYFASDADLHGSHVKAAHYDGARSNQHNEFYWRRRLEAPLRFFQGAW
jgi:enterochelin esterase-like enzyme